MPTLPTSAAMCSVENTSEVRPLSLRISMRARGFDEVVTIPAASVHVIYIKNATRRQKKVNEVIAAIVCGIVRLQFIRFLLGMGPQGKLGIVESRGSKLM
jgi:hypothetical protein